MRFFECDCGGKLFFHNTSCVACQRDVGFCPSCRSMTALDPSGGDTVQCSCTGCRSTIVKCKNYAFEKVCNWCVTTDSDGQNELCRSCELTSVIPDLSVEGNKQRWAKLEEAKRRMLYTLDLLNLSFDSQNGQLPLSFEFKGDPIVGHNWHHLAGGGQVFTGHANGVITINIQEADSVQREQTRIQMGEDLRTLVGHFRHEIGHYYWERLVAGRCESEFVSLFGDHTNPGYAEAKDAYYANGPAVDWEQHYVTKYASMHPWEDFAETFAAYQDIISMLDTAGHVGLIEPVDLTAQTSSLISTYQRLGMAVNELNREMGLLDPVPFVLTGAINQKVDFIHALVRGA
ncbi:MAG: putative zinc-binding metallopeptidase [Planctomycetaceae bacterium]